MLPPQLLRYTLSFLRWTPASIYRVCLVSRGWKAAITAPGVVATCRVRVQGKAVPPQPDRALQLLSGVHRMSISAHKEPSPFSSPAAWASLGRLHSLDISVVQKLTLTSAMLAQLTSLRRLTVGYLRVAGLSDAAFAPLTALRDLRLVKVTGLELTAEAFRPLRELAKLECTDSSTVDSRCLLGLSSLTSLTADFRIPASALGQQPCLRELDMRSKRWSAEMDDSEFMHLTGLTELAMTHCRHEALTNAAFGHLSGLRQLDINYCHAGITGSSFKVMTSLEVLYMAKCASITSEALAGLGSLRHLALDGAAKSGITDDAFSHLTALTTLALVEVHRTGMTSAAFSHMRRLESVVMVRSSQPSIGDDAFSHLTALTKLVLDGCSSLDISFASMPRLLDLKLSKCCQEGINDDAFRHLTALRRLDIADCTQDTLTSSAFTHLPRLHRLAINHCAQLTVTEEAAKVLTSLTYLRVRRSGPVATGVVEAMPQLVTASE